MEQALARYRRDGAWRVEWKTRGHDRAPGLNEALLDHGFVAAEQEAIMIGPARALAIEVPLPAGIVVERASTSTQIQAALIAQDEIFGEPLPPAAHERLLERALAGDGVEMWLARAGDTVVSAGRLEPVAGTDFAGIWGGATRPEWRHQGIYRALTAARASSALAGGKTLIHSDSTPFSQPILERAGLVAVSTTTPYFWRP
ncbi:GNAT family N-acetyltransferase [Piscicoccus intestinalis]|uniref:GNAT family N-acetyltransferase n=1 Tax=Piscicoccus intestinalis TaxID=746033 RepID=UPI000AB64B96|nr:GNAT family N-acetyltransferase [Piscicoccus intestinalis]